MKLVYVIDQYDDVTNGTTASAQRFAKRLQARGHEIRVLAANTKIPGEPPVETREIPFFQNMIDEQGFALAKRSEKEVYEKAFEAADLVHFFVPSPFCARGAKIAEAMDVPRVTAFHVQPKNITYSFAMGTKERANDLIYRSLKRHFYKDFHFIHCPSRMIADELRRHGYKGDLRVISNGINDFFEPVAAEKPADLADKIVLLTVGRLSGEKRQDLLIEAAQLSRYKDKIQVIIAGKGPKEKKLRKLAENLNHEPIFGFYDRDELRKLYSSCDLYIHPADAETEGISCMEAIACGAVPVISNSKYSATGTFAADDRSLFKAGDAADLARKIDAWIEQPEELKRMRKVYAKRGEDLHIDASVTAFERFYEDAIAYYRA